jgi:hypothetical protein
MVKLYEMMGWDVATACPTRAHLEDLEIGWVADRVEASRASA